MAVNLALLGAVDAAQADAFGVVIGQDFDGIAANLWRQNK
jgi:hypothetical protein